MDDDPETRLRALEEEVARLSAAFTKLDRWKRRVHDWVVWPFIMVAGWFVWQFLFDLFVK